MALLVLPQGIADSGSLLIEDGRITRIFESPVDQSIKADSIIDLNGLTLFPGFIDIHIHETIGVDTMEANPDDLLRVAEFLARNGVTAWLPTLLHHRINHWCTSPTVKEGSAFSCVQQLSPPSRSG